MDIVVKCCRHHGSDESMAVANLDLSSTCHDVLARSSSWRTENLPYELSSIA